jgi:hypothetical protein
MESSISKKLIEATILLYLMPMIHHFSIENPPKGELQLLPIPHVLNINTLLIAHKIEVPE